MDRAQIVLAATATKIPATARGRVLVCGSHAGAYAGYLAARAAVRAVILNDAGVGLDDAGIGALAQCQSLGMAAAAVAHSSACIGDAADMLADGVISHCNAAAAAVGVSPGMGCAEAAALLRRAPAGHGESASYDEARTLVGENRHGLRIVCVDSVSLVLPEDAGQIVVSGSHGGVVSGQRGLAIRVAAAAAFYNDAGVGKQEAGVSRLPVLDEQRIAAATAGPPTRVASSAASIRQPWVSVLSPGCRPGKRWNTSCRLTGLFDPHLGSTDHSSRFALLEGEVVVEAPQVPANVDKQRLLEHYRSMCGVRAFEETALEALEDGLVPGPIHPSIGQEAVASGVCGNLEVDDILLSTHRGHGHTLVKGASPLAMMRELLGRAGGCCGGKGGSMHIADFSVGMLGANGVVGANILIATGAAHAIKLRGESRVAVCIFGDGAINRGPFLEGLNWAKIFALPVLFFCEDNQFAATTRSGSVSAGEGPAARAESLGIRSVTVNGNDVLEVDGAIRDSLAGLRAGQGPCFIHALTYRLSGHTAADAAGYRDSEEVAERWGEDPIARAASMLADAGISLRVLEDIKVEARNSMRAVLDEARASPWPEDRQAHQDVQDTPGQGLARSA